MQVNSKELVFTETCTRWSETCCIRFTTPHPKDDDVTKSVAAKTAKGKEVVVKPPMLRKESNPRRSEPIQVLLELMDRCCRSIADQDILLIAVTILINLAKVTTVMPIFRLWPLLFPQRSKCVGLRNEKKNEVGSE